MTEYVTHIEVIEDQPAFLMRRVRGHAGTYLTQADLMGTIGVKVFDLSSTTPGTAIVTTTITIASCIFDTLQTDARWTRDSIGYNFGAQAPGTYWPTGGRIYQVEYLFDPVGGDDFRLLFIAHARSVLGS